MAKAVALKEEPKTDVAIAAYDWGADAGGGFEGTTSSDLSIPFLGILQSNSPQVENDDPVGSRPGMLYNTVTKQLYDGDKGIAILPAHKEVAYVEWVPRNKGGGFVGLHDVNSPIVKKAIDANGGQKFGKLQLGEHELIETHYIYALVLSEDGKSSEGFCVISFTSTKIKPFKDWTTAMYTLKGRPPLWANRARIKTIKQKNEHGTYYNFRIDPLTASWSSSLVNPAVEGDLLVNAREFREMVTSGLARAAFETERDAAGVGSAADADGEAAPF
jgi:hypothetical protein